MAKKAVKVNESENIKRASRVFSNINFKTLGKINKFNEFEFESRDMVHFA